jgi:hypothetical protein
MASAQLDSAVQSLAANSRNARSGVNARLWTGRVVTGLVTLFLGFDLAIKLLQLPVALRGTQELGYPTSVVFGLGLVLLGCLVLHLIPRTSLLGAVLLTGYLGGAVATHVRVGNPLFSHVLFPVYVGVLIWGGLCLRDDRVRALLGLPGRA